MRCTSLWALGALLASSDAMRIFSSRTPLRLCVVWLLVSLTACEQPPFSTRDPVGDDVPDAPDDSQPDASSDPTDDGSNPPPPDDPGENDEPDAGSDDRPPDAGMDMPPSEPCSFAASRRLTVSSTSELAAALSDVEAGDLIELEDGTYDGSFRLEGDGTAGARIVLCGSANAVFVGSGGKNAITLAADHWVLSGFSVTMGLRGVVLEGANDSLLTGLTVHHVGQEAIHLLNHSSRNTVARCRIYETGLDEPGFGEGIYLGSARGNWQKVTGSDGPDRSNDNQVLDNQIGPNVRAEHIDVKEGTQGGVLRGNVFMGAGISGENYADSWVDVKGNDYLIEANSGSDSPVDGFQTHVVEDAWGHDIRFRGNVAHVNGDGYGFSVSGDGRDVVIECDNQVEGAGSGFANVPCSL
jgi:hypothetical protein